MSDPERVGIVSGVLPDDETFIIKLVERLGISIEFHTKDEVFPTHGLVDDTTIEPVDTTPAPYLYPDAELVTGLDLDNATLEDITSRSDIVAKRHFVLFGNTIPVIGKATPGRSFNTLMDTSDRLWIHEESRIVFSGDRKPAEGLVVKRIRPESADRPDIRLRRNFAKFQQRYLYQLASYGFEAGSLIDIGPAIANGEIETTPKSKEFLIGLIAQLISQIEN